MRFWDRAAARAATMTSSLMPMVMTRLRTGQRGEGVGHLPLRSIGLPACAGVDLAQVVDLAADALEAAADPAHALVVDRAHCGGLQRDERVVLAVELVAEVDADVVPDHLAGVVVGRTDERRLGRGPARCRPRRRAHGGRPRRCSGRRSRRPGT